MIVRRLSWPCRKGVVFALIDLVVRRLGFRDYVPVWEAMRDFTIKRDAATPDHFWLVEHPPVFTQGKNGRPEHILNPGTIPVVQVDRGGQVTYHGPGQVVIYLLVDLRRLNIGVRGFVMRIEQAVISFLADQGIAATSKRDAPGVYVAERKIAALGLRIKRGCSYHGVAFNVDTDLTAFDRISPCGYRNLQITQLKELGVSMSWWAVADALCEKLRIEFDYVKEPVVK